MHSLYNSLVEEVFNETIASFARNSQTIGKVDLAQKLSRVKSILLNAYDKTIDEIISEISEDFLYTTHDITYNRKLSPGIASSILVPNGLAVTAYAGRINSNPTSSLIGAKTLIDIASTSKIFTAMLMCELHDEGKIDIYKPICEIDPTFKHLPMSIVDLLRFEYRIRTKDRIDAVEAGRFVYSKDDALCLLRNASNITKVYEYSDIPYMIAAALVPNFSEEMNAFLKKEGLNDTMFNPKGRITTGGPYGKTQQVHDSKAQVLNGESGHAGLFSTTKDLTKVQSILLRVNPEFIEEMIRPRNYEDLTSKENQRGMVYIKHPLGLRYSEVPPLASDRTLATEGTTGNWSLYDLGNNYTANYMANPLSSHVPTFDPKETKFTSLMDPYKTLIVDTALMLKIASIALAKSHGAEEANKCLDKHL